MKRVILLGRNGFISKSLADLLSRKKVETLAVSSAEADLTKFSSIDYLRKIIRKDDALVFTSMLTPDKGKDVDSQIKNILMGRNLAAALEAAPCSHVLYLSSDAVYADELSFVSETDPCDPSSLYGSAHLLREKILRETTKKIGVPLFIVRPPALYGAADTHNSYGPNRFMRSALGEGKIALFGQGEEKRDHVFIEDLCELMWLGLSQKTDGVLNPATGHSVSFMELALMIQELCGTKIDIQGSPRKNAVTFRHYDTAATLRTFPLFKHTALREGLKKSLLLLKEGSR